MIVIQKPQADLGALLNDGPVTRLHLDGDHITLEVLSGGDSPHSTALEVGSLRSILAHLRHEPATADELEAAIATIEDRLMPIISLLPTRRCLVTSAPAVCDIAKVVGVNDTHGLHLDIATVERLFNRLADTAYGTPAAQYGIPASRDFAAALLMLRELLHHAGFESVFIMG
jgi:hypothetical protein